MKNIFRFIARYHFTLIFVLLELVSFSLIVRRNNYQRTVFFKETTTLFSYTSSVVSSVDEYFGLRNYNRQLSEENVELRNRLETIKKDGLPYFNTSIKRDSLNNYTYYAARVINNSYNRTKNYITLNKGTNDNINSEMGVCEGNNVVGIILHTSSNFAIVLPLIHTDTRLSAKISKNGYYGSLQWDGGDYRYAYLNDIPFHVDVVPGDTIVTTGFADHFPEGLVAGYVESVDHDVANFLTIKVRFAVDFRQLREVNIIENNWKQEKNILEEEAYNKIIAQ